MRAAKVVRVLVLAAAGLVATLAVACGSDEAIPTNSVAGPTVTVAVQEDGALTSLAVSAVGLEAGGDYLALLHVGTCEEASGSAGRLGILTADGSGAASLTTSTALVGAVGEPTDLTPAMLADGDHVIRIVRVGGDEVACVPLP